MDNTYEALSARTLSPAAAALARIRKHPHLFGFLLELRTKTVITETLSDSLKREIFYGQDKGLKNVISNLPPKVSMFGVVKLIESLDEPRVNLIHAALGVLSEAGEFFDGILKHLVDGKPLDAVNLKEEAGDLLFYLAIICRMYGFNLHDVMVANIQKLAARYGDQFSDLAAITRDLGAERAILERKTPPENLEDYDAELIALHAMRDEIVEAGKDFGWKEEEAGGPIAHLRNLLGQNEDAIKGLEIETERLRNTISDLHKEMDEVADLRKWQAEQTQRRQDAKASSKGLVPTCSHGVSLIKDCPECAKMAADKPDSLRHHREKGKLSTSG